MNTKVAWIVLVVLGLLLIGWFLVSTNADTTPAATLEEVATSTDSMPSANEEDGGPAFTVITLTDAGFSPSTVTVSNGETVRFVNESSRGMWVGADEHPTHTEYDGTSTREHCVDGAPVGGSFDQCGSVARGNYWDYTFTKSGTFGYHNHVGASSVGTVIVR